MREMRKAHALVVMVKPPIAGMVKTRLVPPLSAEEAAALYHFFIKDIFTSIATLNDLDLFVAVAPASDSFDFLKSTIPQGIERFEQEGSSLGERLYNVFKRLFKADYSRVAVIGSDSPDLKPEFIEEGFGLLNENKGNVVLGPAFDGGYYLIAMDSLDKRPFKDIPWSGASVLEETIERLYGSAMLLPLWHDIDTAEDIVRLAESGTAKESVAYLKERNLFKRCAEFAIERSNEKEGGG